MRHLHIATGLMIALAAAPLLAQNTNQDAPLATHVIEFADESKIEVTYRQLTLAGGRNLKTLLAEGVQGNQQRKFYNEQYLPNFLDGSIMFSKEITLGGETVKQGSYGFTFRIDNELKWHFILTKNSKDACDVTLEAASNVRKRANRLIVLPVATADDSAEGHLNIKYGPLSAMIPFAASKATSAGK